MKLRLNIAILFFSAIVLATTSGCTSSSYGNSFVQVQTNQSPNQYKLKIFTGGFAGSEYAKKDLDIEAKKFMATPPEYIDYKIISSEFQLIPSGVTFIVEFLTET